MISYQKMYGQTFCFYIRTISASRNLMIEGSFKIKCKIYFKDILLYWTSQKTFTCQKDVDMASNLIDRLICVTFLSKSDFFGFDFLFLCKTIFCSLWASTTTNSLNDTKHLISKIKEHEKLDLLPMVRMEMYYFM